MMLEMKMTNVSVTPVVQRECVSFYPLMTLYKIQPSWDMALVILVPNVVRWSLQVMRQQMVNVVKKVKS